MANEKRARRRRGESFIQSLPIRCDTGAIGKTGEELSEDELMILIKNTCCLASQVAQQSLNKLWNQANFDEVSILPGMAYRAVEKTIGVQKIEGIHTDSRLNWLGEEIAGRIMKACSQEAQVVNNIINDTPAGYVEKTWYRNLQRALENHKSTHSRAAKDYFEWKTEAPIVPKNILPLAATDKQFVRWTADGLLMKVAISNEPQNKTDWIWIKINVDLPGYVQQALNNGGQLLLPSLRIKNSKIILDLAIETRSPVIALKTRTVVGVDWGERRHLTLTDGWLDAGDRVCLSGRPQFFNARGLQYLQACRRERAGELRSQRDKLDALLRGKPDQPTLIEKRAAIEAERASVWSAYNRCSQQWSHAAARWIIEQAKTIGADTIILEDLKSLESRLPNKGVNGRVNHQIRGAVYNLVEHKAKMEGIRIQYVNTRGTSSTCPLCQGNVKHHKASNDQAAGRSWSTCTQCDYSRDRDVMAAQHIIVRGLRKHQAKKLQSYKPRRVTRPNLTPHKKSKRSRINFNGERERHVPSGIAVRSQSSLRANLHSWSQREYHNSHHIHRDLHGLQGGYTGRIRLTPSRPSPLSKNSKKL